MRGFTLIELLVVIAIIALLVSLLVPSLNESKALAERALCGNQEKNIGLGMSLYQSDNNGYFLGNGPVANEISFLGLRDQVAGQRPYVSTPSLMCPTQARIKDSITGSYPFYYTTGSGPLAPKMTYWYFWAFGFGGEESEDKSNSWYADTTNPPQPRLRIPARVDKIKCANAVFGAEGAFQYRIYGYYGLWSLPVYRGASEWCRPIGPLQDVGWGSVSEDYRYDVRKRFFPHRLTMNLLYADGHVVLKHVSDLYPEDMSYTPGTVSNKWRWSMNAPLRPSYP